MKFLIALSLLVGVTGCSHYSPSDSISEVGEQGYRVSCNASPVNQPGCYSPTPSWHWWPSDKIKFELGSK